MMYIFNIMVDFVKHSPYKRIFLGARLIFNYNADNTSTNLGIIWK